MIRRVFGPTFRALKRAAGFAALFFCAGVACAEDVRLIAKSGSFELVGRLLEYDGSYYRIASQYGPVTALAASVTCEGVDCPGDGPFVPRVRVTAAPEFAEVLLPALIQRYASVRGFRVRSEPVSERQLIMTLEEDAQTVARFDIRVALAEEGLADLVSFDTDMFATRRDLSLADEMNVRVPSDGFSTVIGYDAMTPVVSPRRRVQELSPKQLIGVLDGSLTDWAEIGGAPGPIRLQISRDGPTWLKATGARLHDDFETAVAAVVSDPNALGLVSFQESGFAQQMDLIDACGLVATPVQATVKTGDYPLTVPIYLHFADRRMQGIVQDLVAWLPSPQAQLVVRRSGFVDAGLLPIPLNDQGQRFVNALRSAESDDALQDLRALTLALDARTRMSLSFRFEPGGVELDAVSRAQMSRLSTAIQNGAFDRRSLLLVGFSDGQGNAARNKVLSLRRARAVREALLSSLPDELGDRLIVEIEGFGEALPVGCDDTTWGRQQNRRVELWVGD